MASVTKMAEISADFTNKQTLERETLQDKDQNHRLWVGMLTVRMATAKLLRVEA
jgi:hypothetical protein